MAHPIIRIHPEINKKSLCLGIHVGHVCEIPIVESMRLLENTTVERNIYRHS